MGKEHIKLLMEASTLVDEKIIIKKGMERKFLLMVVITLAIIN